MRYLFSLLLATSFLTHSAAAQVVSAPKDTIATRVQLPGADCALFPAAAKMEHQMEEEMPNTGRFMPTRQQVVAVEHLLPSVTLEKVYDPKAGPAGGYYANYPLTIKQSLPKYQRQYYGFYNSAHQPCLFINFFIESYEDVTGRPAVWLYRRIFFFDGGATLWRIYYNLATHKFYNFSHNMEG